MNLATPEQRDAVERGIDSAMAAIEDALATLRGVSADEVRAGFAAQGRPTSQTRNLERQMAGSVEGARA